MEFKKFKMRLGEYHKHPKDCELKTFSLPEDTLFFTRGEDDIGNGKHIGALHYLCLTKATDKELIKHMKSFNPEFLTYRNYQNEIVRWNGYALLAIHDCIMETPIKLIDEDELNEFLDPQRQFFIYISEDNHIIKIIRLNRILSESRIMCSVNYLHGEISSNRECNTILCDDDYSMSQIIAPYHTIKLIHLDNEYAETLFMEAMYTNLSKIYPGFKNKLIGYDFEWLAKESEIIYGELFTKKPKENTENNGEVIDLDGYMKAVEEATEKIENVTKVMVGRGPKKGIDYDLYNDIFHFRKPLPLIPLNKDKNGTN